MAQVVERDRVLSWDPHGLREIGEPARRALARPHLSVGAGEHEFGGYGQRGATAQAATSSGPIGMWRGFLDFGNGCA